MHEKAKRKKSVSFIKPELATLTEKRFSDSKWIFERKFDGVRVIGVGKKGKVTLYSRNQNRLNNSYPELVEALEKQGKKDFVVDGEIIAMEKGVSSFSKLQKRMHIQSQEKARSRGVKVYLYLFDIPYFNGWDLRSVPLVERKKILKKSMKYGPQIRYTSHKIRQGEAYYKIAKVKGWEGVIAKKANSTYQSKRGKNWLKFKCINQQELVIGGYTKPQGSRVGFGALLMGYYEKGKFKYAGKVGTGYNEELLRKLSAKMQRIERTKSPFSSRIKEVNAHWIQPKYVAQIGFTEWTRDGKLRHPRFLGIRTDKPAKSIKREG